VVPPGSDNIQIQRRAESYSQSEKASAILPPELFVRGKAGPSINIESPRPCVRRHILSVDVEDYFQVEAFADRIPRSKWESYPSRVEQNTMQLLDLFDEHEAKATFFLVGWIVERFPGLVREIVKRGHEPACHSYWHRTVYSLTRDEFREDTHMARDRVEQIGGVRVLGYRAPTWSIIRSSLWALEELGELGFVYDSSIYPIRHDLYGLPGAGSVPYTHHLRNGHLLREFPPATTQIAGLTIPVAGGGYLRIFPLAFTHWAFRRMEKNTTQPMVVYMHPWEIDPDQPKLAGRWKSRLRHYTNLAKMKGRLESLLQRYAFWAFRDLLNAEAREMNCPAHNTGNLQVELKR
jgi:polysaccharide deacetylase family protein (PEP-CTERM system associated)